MLHVVNGDETARALRESGVLSPLDPALPADRDPDDVIAWRDVLHEGPVRSGRSPVNLAHERCQFIASQGWEPYISVRQHFGRRDSVMASTKRQDEVVFWFESDLYDQLQLVQALDRLAARRPESTRFSWVLVDRSPSDPDRHGFSSLSTPLVESLLVDRQPVPEDAWMEARSVWTAFTSGKPDALAAIVGRDVFTIPWLRDALRRLLAEFPAVVSGLSESERQVLASMEGGPVTPFEIFARIQAIEPRPFLGDTQVWDRFDRFATASEPLIGRDDGQPWVTARVNLVSIEEPDLEAFHAQRLRLTETGKAVLAGVRDWLVIAKPDRWIGGYHVPTTGAGWRYDPDTESLVSPEDAG